jgi:hypothetical protein
MLHLAHLGHICFRYIRCEKSLFSKKVFSGSSIHVNFFPFLSLKPKEQKVKARTERQGRQKDQKGREVKLRDLMVQPRILEGVQRRTQEVQKGLNKKASQKTRRKPRGVVVF